MEKNTSNKNDEHFDAIVFGGGIAGCAAAIELNASGWKVALLQGKTSLGGTESISSAATKSLRRYSAQQGTPFTKVISWWGSAVPTIAASDGARIVQRERLIQALWSVIVARQIEVVQLNRLQLLEKADGFWQITLEVYGKRQTLNTRYLIDASGRSSVVGRWLGSARKCSDRLCCLSAGIENSVDVGVWTEAVENGWWNLCSGGTQGTLSFFTIPQILKSVSRDFLLWLGQTHEMKKLQAPTHARNMRVRPCGSSILSPCAGPGWLAIGDAVMTFQPLASAGVANALRDAKEVLLYLTWNPADYDYFKRLQYSKYLQAMFGQYTIEKRWQGSVFWDAFSHVHHSKSVEVIRSSAS